MCRTAAEQIEKPVVVADVPLSAAEAWRVVETIQLLQFDPSKKGDWITEGF